jgi:hypothetical protein
VNRGGSTRQGSRELVDVGARVGQIARCPTTQSPYSPEVRVTVTDRAIESCGPYGCATSQPECNQWTCAPRRTLMGCQEAAFVSDPHAVTPGFCIGAATATGYLRVVESLNGAVSLGRSLTSWCTEH